MAAACPSARERGRPRVVAVRELSEEARAAEAIWRLVIDAQRDDLDLLRRRWPDRESAESRGAIERLKRRAAVGGDAEQALEAVHAAYGGWGRAPRHVSERLERYVEEQLGRRPWPERDLAEHTDEPALVRKRRRQHRVAPSSTE